MSCNVHCIHGSSTCVGRLVLRRKPGSSLGYLFSWLYPYPYGASFSIWFTTLSRSYRNPSSGTKMNNYGFCFVYMLYVQSHLFTVLLLCFFKIRILWMVPIYSLDSVSSVFFSQKRPTFAVDIKTVSLKAITPHFSLYCLFQLAVDCLEIPQHCHLRGHMQRVLRGLRHLQLHDLLAQLPWQPVSQPGDDAGGPGAAETPAPSLLLPPMADGRVSFS